MYREDLIARVRAVWPDPNPVGWVCDQRGGVATVTGTRERPVFVQVSPYRGGLRAEAVFGGAVIRLEGESRTLEYMIGEIRAAVGAVHKHLPEGDR